MGKNLKITILIVSKNAYLDISENEEIIYHNEFIEDITNQQTDKTGKEIILFDIFMTWPRDFTLCNYKHKLIPNE